MKKIMIIAVACVALAACSKEDISKAPVSLTGNIDIPVTKITPDDPTAETVSFSWDDGDVVYIYGDGSSQLLDVTQDNCASFICAIASTRKFDYNNGDKSYTPQCGDVVYFNVHGGYYVGSKTLFYKIKNNSFVPFASGTVNEGGTSFSITSICPVLHITIKNDSGTDYESKQLEIRTTGLKASLPALNDGDSYSFYLPFSKVYNTTWSLRIYDNEEEDNIKEVESTKSLEANKIYECPTITL